MKFSGKNPLRDIWVWVCCNIAGQIVTEVESSLIYAYYGHNQCTPVEVARFLPRATYSPASSPVSSCCLPWQYPSGLLSGSTIRSA